MLSRIINGICLFLIIGTAGGVDRGTLALFPACAIIAAALITMLCVCVARESYRKRRHK